MTETPALQKFYVTFGVQYSHEPHPYWDGADPDGWLTVLAPDEEAARLRVRSFIGLKWSMMYDSLNFDETEDRKYFPKGELARISTDGDDHARVGVPTRRFGTSDPEFYGHDGKELIGARIAGHLLVDPSPEMYDVEYTHLGCYAEGVQLFGAIRDTDRAVMAFEMDWSNPWRCAACHRSLT